MPNTKSAIRRVRRVKKQTQINRIRRSKYKNAIKQMELLLKSKDKQKAKKYFSKFQSILMQLIFSRLASVLSLTFFASIKLTFLIFFSKILER